MINLHDHAWQAELPSFPFLPALLKPPSSSPRHYFYSQAQQRILRKKVSGEEAVQSFMKEASQKQSYLIMEISAGNQLTYQLGDSVQIRNAVIKEKIGVCIVNLENNEILIEVQFDVSSKMTVRMLMEYKKDGFWSSQTDFTIKSTQFLHNYMIKLWRELPNLLKISSKCIKISLLLSSKFSLDKFNIVWCNQFIFSKPQFYQIHYKPQFIQNKPNQKHSSKQKSFTNTLIISSSNSESNEPNLQLKMSSQSISSNLPSHAQQQKYEQPSNSLTCICKCCNNLTPEQNTHEVEGTAVIQLRRKKKLSILGLLDEWLLICDSCYNELE